MLLRQVQGFLYLKLVMKREQEKSGLLLTMVPVFQINTLNILEHGNYFIQYIVSTPVEIWSFIYLKAVYPFERMKGNVMTVKQLKEKLEELPEDAEIIITVDWSSSVGKVEYHDKDIHINRPYVELS